MCVCVCVCRRGHSPHPALPPPQIDAVQYVSAANCKAGDTAADVDGALYGGPAFDHLDETLQVGQ